MSGTDSYYTPSPLADRMISLIASSQVKSAIDFCVGDGDLLKAVTRRYNNVTLYGIDISDDALNKLKIERPDWQLSQCDFRDDEWLQQVPFLKDAAFDLIVLNPPFTCKGSVTEHFTFEGLDFKVSTAMHFVMRALRYLNQEGGLYAIVPISCVYSEKDRKAWDYLKLHYNACVLDEPERVSFRKKKGKIIGQKVNCSPKIAIIYAGHYVVKGQAATMITGFSSLPVTAVIRGSVRMQGLTYSHGPESIKLIHTTNMQNGSLVHLKSVVPGLVARVDGFGVVIPRVCNPNPSKIVLLDGSESYVLSDCVIVLRSASKHDAVSVRQYILNNWSSFVSIYKGTGAQYTTLARVKDLFKVRV